MTEVSAIRKRLEAAMSFCDPECRGRCEECPDGLRRDTLIELDRLAAELSASRAREAGMRKALEEAILGMACVGVGTNWPRSHLTKVVIPRAKQALALPALAEKGAT